MTRARLRTRVTHLEHERWCQAFPVAPWATARWKGLSVADKGREARQFFSALAAHPRWQRLAEAAQLIEAQRFFAPLSDVELESLPLLLDMAAAIAKGQEGASP